MVTLAEPFLLVGSKTQVLHNFGVKRPKFWRLRLSQIRLPGGWASEVEHGGKIAETELSENTVAMQGLHSSGLDTPLLRCQYVIVHSTLCDLIRRSDSGCDAN